MKRITILTAALLATTACTSHHAANNTAAAEQQATGTESGIDLAGLDKAVKPGDNFDEYANGGWRAKTEIPADRSSTGVFLEVFNKAEANNRAIIDAALKSDAAAGTDQRKIADYYRAYMDTNGIEQRGLAPLKGELDAIAGLKDKTELVRMLGADMRADEDPINATSLGTENLFGLFVTQALTDPTKTVPYLLQGGLGLPDRDYYISSAPDMAKIRDAYKKYIAQILTLAGVSDAQARAQRIFDLETKLAKVHATLTDTEQMSKGHDAWTKADFAKKAPGIDWDVYWAAAGLPNQRDFIAWQPAAITGEAALVASEPLQAWQDWLTFHRINEAASVLPKAFDAAHFAFYGTTLSGTPQQRPRDKRAIAAVNGALGDAVGQLYVKQYFPASSKADIQHMVQGILAAFDKRVANLDWMAPATKAEARKKIETLKVGIGYPETWRDYSALEVKADDPVGNLRRAELAEYRHQIAKIGKPVDRREWWMTPQTVNAVNLPLQNALNFPAAILQAPFYDPKADAAANYGSIGAVIGHEISHSFDNNGAMFDASGKLRNWWTPADLAHFKQAGEALAKQYDAYEPLPGVHINGEQTLGENIADVAGLTAAYEAYHASLGGKPAPVIDGLTGDQRFFLAFAQSWREKTRPKALRQQLATDGHAPGSYRALTVRNLDAWYPAFDVQQGQKLYLTPDKRVHVW
ncbi:MAG TPA: M13 family metallopeptidase [Sphingomonas sp.]|nr:M13 family metallopeptidase [Sphingomonas sp.]